MKVKNHHHTLFNRTFTILLICLLVSSSRKSSTVQSSSFLFNDRNSHFGECALCSSLKEYRTRHWQVVIAFNHLIIISGSLHQKNGPRLRNKEQLTKYSGRHSGLRLMVSTWFQFWPWLGSLRCDLRQNNLLPKSFPPPRCIKGYQWIFNAGRDPAMD